MRNEREAGGLRDRTRRAVRAELAALALAMFAERGFDETTVDDIARAAGMSKRSFFRYFPAKEDVVFGDVDDTGDRIVEEIRARPADEPPWNSLHHVLRGEEERIHALRDGAAGRRLIETSPALRARFFVKREEVRRRVAIALRDRPGADLDDFTADLLTAAAGAALDAAGREWLRTDGGVERGALIDRAFALLRPDGAGSTTEGGASAG